MNSNFKTELLILNILLNFRQSPIIHYATLPHPASSKNYIDFWSKSEIFRCVRATPKRPFNLCYIIGFFVSLLYLNPCIVLLWISAYSDLDKCLAKSTTLKILENASIFLNLRKFHHILFSWFVKFDNNYVLTKF